MKRRVERLVFFLIFLPILYPKPDKHHHQKDARAEAKRVKFFLPRAVGKNLGKTKRLKGKQTRR